MSTSVLTQSLALSPLSDLGNLLSDEALLSRLRLQFDCGILFEEAFKTLPFDRRVVMSAFFRAEWMAWEAERRVRNSAIMCGNG